MSESSLCSNMDKDFLFFFTIILQTQTEKETVGTEGERSIALIFFQAILLNAQAIFSSVLGAKRFL